MFLKNLLTDQKWDDIPIDDWLRKGLKDFACYYLSKEIFQKTII